MTLENLLALRKRAEEVFEREYRKAVKRVRAEHPRKRVEIARRIARRKMNEFLEEHGLNIELLEAKIAALTTPPKLEELAV